MTLSASVAKESVDPRWLQLSSAEKNEDQLLLLNKMTLCFALSTLVLWCKL